MVERSKKEHMFVMQSFRHGDFRYLNTTDVAARGIDIDAIDLILNFDFPKGSDNYIHRIGRSGRAGLSGKVYTLYTSAETQALSCLIDDTKAMITTLPLSQFELTNDVKDAFYRRKIQNPKQRKDSKNQHCKVIDKKQKGRKNP